MSDLKQLCKTSLAQDPGLGLDKAQRKAQNYNKPLKQFMTEALNPQTNSYLEPLNAKPCPKP